MFAILNSTPLKINLPVAWAWSWISNPLTMMPLYYGYYWLGAQIVPSDSGFVQVEIAFEELGFLGVWGALEPILIQFILGSLIASISASVFGYVATLAIVDFVHQRRGNK